jgi:two-component system phosphate regulon sensor histidine kinase PhoR
MLWHVIDNAVRYGNEPVSVSSELEEGGDLTISVRDNGSGIPEERLQSLREPFAQADQGVMRTSGRYGLGLPVAFRIAERHGAEMTIESRPEAGTHVQIRMPAGRVTGALATAAA